MLLFWWYSFNCVCFYFRSLVRVRRKTGQSVRGVVYTSSSLWLKRRNRSAPHLTTATHFCVYSLAVISSVYRNPRLSQKSLEHKWLCNILANPLDACVKYCWKKQGSAIQGLKFFYSIGYNVLFVFTNAAVKCVLWPVLLWVLLQFAINCCHCYVTSVTVSSVAV